MASIVNIFDLNTKWSLSSPRLQHGNALRFIDHAKLVQKKLHINCLCWVPTPSSVVISEIQRIKLNLAYFMTLNIYLRAFSVAFNEIAWLERRQLKHHACQFGRDVEIHAIPNTNWDEGASEATTFIKTSISFLGLVMCKLILTLRDNNV